MRRVIVAAIVLAVCLVSTSCTDGSGAVSPPGSTATIATSDAPTTSGPADGPPELPEAAKAKTTAGAKAFVRYYVDVLNYSFHTQDTKTLGSLASQRCNVCGAIVTGLNRTRRSGGSQSDGAWSVNEQFSVPGQPTARPKLVANIHISSGHWRRSSSSQVIVIKEQDLSNEFDLQWTDTGWRIGDVREA